MINNMTRRLLWLALLLPLGAAAATPDAYARQWPLRLSRADAGAYRVELRGEVYAAAYWRDWRDVQVLDADGKPVSSAVYPAATATQVVLRAVDLPWFALPDNAATDDSGTLAVLVERGSDGTVVAIRNSAQPPAHAGNGNPAWLIDRGPSPGMLHSLSANWADTQAALDLSYRVEGSDDLRDWQLLDPRMRLLQLRNQNRQLRKDSIALETSLRYLRLVPLLPNGGLAPLGFRGDVGGPARPDQWQWMNATASGTTAAGDLYRIPGRLPVQRLQIVMPANSTASWDVSSRDPADHGGEPTPWRMHATGWTAWNLADGGKSQQSPPLAIAAPTSDREWRLRLASGTTPSARPSLRLGFQAGSVVFLAQGRAPYSLVAGSASQRSRQTTLEPMLAALRASHGMQWQPASADLGTGSVRAGNAAYQPPPVPRDWKTLLLWSVLVLGALTVAAFALNLLHGKSSQ